MPPIIKLGKIPMKNSVSDFSIWPRKSPSSFSPKADRTLESVAVIGVTKKRSAMFARHKSKDVVNSKNGPNASKTPNVGPNSGTCRSSKKTPISSHKNRYKNSDGSVRYDVPTKTSNELITSGLNSVSGRWCIRIRRAPTPKSSPELSKMGKKAKLSRIQDDAPWLSALQKRAIAAQANSDTNPRANLRRSTDELTAL